MTSKKSFPYYCIHKTERIQVYIAFGDLQTFY